MSVPKSNGQGESDAISIEFFQVLCLAEIGYDLTPEQITEIITTAPRQEMHGKNTEAYATDFIEYIRHGSNYTKAGKSLNKHPNTVIYSVKRAKAILLTQLSRS